MLTHAILEGRVHHQRSEPTEHQFDYALNLAAIRLDDINGFTHRSNLLRKDKPGVFTFQRADFHGPRHISIDQSVRNTVFQSTGAAIEGPILLVGMLRHFGHSFNPVSFYLCYNKAETAVEYIVAEITNTPWGQRYAYVLGPKQNTGTLTHHIYDFDKLFHVSPFHGMQQKYHWEFTFTESDISICMKNIENEKCIFTATYAASFKTATRKSINALFYKFPAASLRAITLIYLNALKLRIKKIPFYEHPQYRNA